VIIILSRDSIFGKEIKMKKICFILVILLIVIGSQVFAQLTEPQVLIDFNDLKADATKEGDKEPSENQATIVDYRSQAGAGIPEKDLELLKTSLAIGNWEVHLSSSSEYRENVIYTYAKEAATIGTAADFEGEEMKNKTVLAVRVHFPVPAFNSYAIVKPPFEIPAYMDKEGDENKGKGDKFDNKGIIKNVGAIKEIQMVVSGRNFPHGIGMIFRNQNGEERTVFLGYLNYNGWKRLKWENPNYVTDVRNRKLASFPLYPQSEPFIKFIGIIVYRDAAHTGGDFVFYVKDVKIKYDYAWEKFELDIDDEKVWGIMQQREEARRKAEIRRLGNLHILRYLEKKKMYKEETESGPK
jgi:hypothetical protein